MLGAVVVDDVDLHHRILLDAQVRVHLPLCGSGFADVDQLAVGDVGSQGEDHIGHVFHIGTATGMVGKGRSTKAQQPAQGKQKENDGSHRFDPGSDGTLRGRVGTCPGERTPALPPHPSFSLRLQAAPGRPLDAVKKSQGETWWFVAGPQRPSAGIKPYASLCVYS